MELQKQSVFRRRKEENMSKIVAIGGGFDGRHGDFLVRHILSLCDKEKPNFLTIPTTIFDNFDTSMYSRFFNWGCEVDALFVTRDYVTEALIAEKIRKADVIHVPGGNLRFVAEMWRRYHVDKYLREAAQAGKVLFGASSGSMCWFREGYDDCGPEHEFMFVDCLDLIPYCNCPHYDSETWQSFNDVVRSRKISSIACENDAAICFVDDKRYILHSPERPDARCWFFDAEDDYRRIDLDAHPEVLERL